MRIVCISDTHSLHRDIEHIPDGDVLVHAGDWSGRGTVNELIAFNAWLGTLPHKHKLVTAGNHDAIAKNFDFAQNALSSARLLIDKAAVIDGVKFYLTPWTPTFGHWSFMRDRGRPIGVKWDNIPDDTDVLVSHGPPLNVLDECGNGHVGCADLLSRVLLVKPKLHIFGHIHEGYGLYKGLFTTFVNASICDGGYNPVNAPIVVDL